MLELHALEHTQTCTLFCCCCSSYDGDKSLEFSVKRNEGLIFEPKITNEEARRRLIIPSPCREPAQAQQLLKLMSCFTKLCSSYQFPGPLSFKVHQLRFYFFRQWGHFRYSAPSSRKRQCSLHLWNCISAEEGGRSHNMDFENCITLMAAPVFSVWL